MSAASADDWFKSLSADRKPILELLRRLIMGCGKNIVEDFKWRRPVYSVGGVLFCYLHETKNHATLGFHRGTSLDDPKGLLEGTGKDMRHIKIRTMDDVDKATFTRLLRQAAGLHT